MAPHSHSQTHPRKIQKQREYKPYTMPFSINEHFEKLFRPDGFYLYS